MQSLHINVNDYIRGYDFLPRVQVTIKALVYLWDQSMLYCDEKMLLTLKRKTLEWVKDSSSSYTYSDRGFKDPMWMGDFLSLTLYVLIEHVWKSSWLSLFFVEEKEKRVDIVADALWEQRHKIDYEVIALVTSESLLPNLTHSGKFSGPKCRPAAMKLLELVSSQSE
mmetsp:Transcript_3269/g.4881  ORF Transcript_3269/g.4881 Transcript_3269/m.4881 type:complete len:167 (-) Transcript_3269:101-601(-)